MYKIVLIGAGSANFGLEAVSDIYRSKILEGSNIVLHDTDEKSLKETQSVAEKYNDIFTNNILSQSDMENYREAYVFQEQCKWKSANKHILKINNKGE